MTARRTTWAWLTALGLLTTGCWSTTVSNGQPAGITPTDWEGRWHSGAVFGTIEISGPYDLAAICPAGWAEIQTKTSLWNGLLILFTFDMYSTQTVTVRCAATAGNQRHALGY